MEGKSIRLVISGGWGKLVEIVKYHKTNHASKLLELLDVDKVRKASPYCDRIFTTLAATMATSAS